MTDLSPTKELPTLDLEAMFRKPPGTKAPIRMDKIDQVHKQVLESKNHQTEFDWLTLLDQYMAWLNAWIRELKLRRRRKLRDNQNDRDCLARLKKHEKSLKPQHEELNQNRKRKRDEEHLQNMNKRARTVMGLDQAIQVMHLDDQSTFQVDANLLELILSFLEPNFSRSVNTMNMRLVSRVFSYAYNHCSLLWKLPDVIRLDIHSIGGFPNDRWARRQLIYCLNKAPNMSVASSMLDRLEQHRALELKVIHREFPWKHSIEMAELLMMHIPIEIFNENACLMICGNTPHSLIETLAEQRRTGQRTILDLKRFVLTSIDSNYYPPEQEATRVRIEPVPSRTERYERLNLGRLFHHIKDTVTNLDISDSETMFINHNHRLVFPMLKTLRFQRGAPCTPTATLQGMAPNLEKTIWVLTEKGQKRHDEGPDRHIVVLSIVGRFGATRDAVLRDPLNHPAYLRLMSQGKIHLRESSFNHFVVLPERYTAAVDATFCTLDHVATHQSWNGIDRSLVDQGLIESQQVRLFPPVE